MIVSRPLAALALAAALLSPVLASAQNTPRLSLNPADADRDGVVTDAERDIHLGARTDSDIALSISRHERPTTGLDRTPEPPTDYPVSLARRIDRDRSPLENGPLSLDRRIVPASEFEIAQEHQFQQAWNKKH